MQHPDRRTFLGAVAGAAAATTLNPLRAQEPAGTAQIGKTPHTRFAMNVEMWWRKLPLLDRIRAAAKLGFEAVEFWPWKGKDLGAIAEVCAETGVSVAQFTGWGFVPGMNDPANHARFLADVEKGCEVAHQLRCKMMTVVAGNDQPGMSQAEMHEHVIKALKQAAPVAEAHEVMLILEPMNIRVDHKGHCLYGSPDAVRICREVDSPMVKINWDLYHMQISEGDLCGRLREGYDQVGYVQLADHPGRHEPGTGEIHYPRVLRQLHDLGYRGFVGVECSPSVAETEAARRLARADVW